jgi:hypothetical protein
MAYSGKFKPKNTSKYDGDPNKVVYRSLWELHCFKWCDTNKDIKSWSSEEVVIPYKYDVDNRYHRYFMDLRITFNDGKTTLVEIKPAKETIPPVSPKRRTKRFITESLTYVKNQNKWAATREYVADRDWEFEIWTEHTLHAMGIMPKYNKLKKLKPLKPLRAPKKKK